jgi:hypothetical protein
MTPEKQRMAIAEACGWKNVDAGSGRVWGITTRHKGTPSEFDVCVDVPNYPFDLNAMHEAEKVLTNEQDLEYSEALEQVVGARFGCNNAEDMRRLRSATAAQRAEAFLRTIGKWEEAK